MWLLWMALASLLSFLQRLLPLGCSHLPTLSPKSPVALLLSFAVGPEARPVWAATSAESARFFEALESCSFKIWNSCTFELYTSIMVLLHSMYMPRCCCTFAATVCVNFSHSWSSVVIFTAAALACVRIFLKRLRWPWESDLSASIFFSFSWRLVNCCFRSGGKTIIPSRPFECINNCCSCSVNAEVESLLTIMSDAAATGGTGRASSLIAVVSTFLTPANLEVGVDITHGTLSANCQSSASEMRCSVCGASNGCCFCVCFSFAFFGPLDLLLVRLTGAVHTLLQWLLHVRHLSVESGFCFWHCLQNHVMALYLRKFCMRLGCSSTFQEWRLFSTPKAWRRRRLLFFPRCSEVNDWTWALKRWRLRLNDLCQCCSPVVSNQYPESPELVILHFGGNYLICKN